MAELACGNKLAITTGKKLPAHMRATFFLRFLGGLALPPRVHLRDHIALIPGALRSEIP